MARLRASTHELHELAHGWTCEIAGERLDAPVPGTLAAALRAAGRLDVDRPLPADAATWRLSLDLPERADGEELWLRLDGLATLAEVRLDGEVILTSENMFHAHEVNLTSERRGRRLLELSFASLSSALGARRPRPRWKTRLVASQQLRWFRTSLLGHMPGWTPPLPAVGPWRPVVLERRRAVRVELADLQVAPRGEGGVARVALTVRPISCAVRGAELRLGGAMGALTCTAEGGAVHVRGELHSPGLARWWPHTHGEPALHDLAVTLDTSAGPVRLDAGKVGVRDVRVSTEDGGFSLSVNGAPVFGRGACWTPLDVVSPGAAPQAELERALDQAVVAGMNLLRVAGPMVYESPAFFEGCARRGIMVWQDFMLASMDYPGGDAAFVASLRREAEQVLGDLQGNPALAVVCGGSEVEQQAAMMGVPPAELGNPILDEILPAAAASKRPDVPWWRGSPGGGALPFHPDTNVSHYYGVGAYLRPFEDLRLARVRFTTECLGFSNVPEETTVEKVLGDGQAPFHHPRWKARVPRDSGAGWDFEDVRDFYLRLLFDVDPMLVRYRDPQRYLQLSRATSCEVMARALAELRRAGSECRGAVVWFLRDLLPGAGWGVVDATGLPKAAWHGLRRSGQPQLLAITDEGLNGLAVHLVNDGPLPLGGDLTVKLYRDGEVEVAAGTARLEAPARGAAAIGADAVLGRFLDSALAYRFGPPGHDLAVATLGNLQALWFRPALAGRRDPGLSAHAEPTPEGTRVTVRARSLAQSVTFECPDHVPDDAWFHLPPGGERQVLLRPVPGARAFSGWVQALNAAAPVRIEMAG